MHYLSHIVVGVIPGLESMRRTYGVETDKENAKFLSITSSIKSCIRYDANAEEALLRLYAVDRGLKKRGIYMGLKLLARRCT